MLTEGGLQPYTEHHPQISSDVTCLLNLGKTSKENFITSEESFQISGSHPSSLLVQANFIPCYLVPLGLFDSGFTYWIYYILGQFMTDILQD